MFDTLMFKYDYIVYMVIGAVLALALSSIIFALWHRRRITNMRISFMQRLPMTLEQIDANLELQKAHHMVDICKYELEIAQIRESEAEADARLQEARSRIDELTRKLEIYQIRQAASRKMKSVRKIEEKMLKLDHARNTIDKNVDSLV